jgi:hypothetical protein
MTSEGQAPDEAELAYCRGARQAMQTLLRMAIRELGVYDAVLEEETPELKAAKLLAEREEAVAMLRQLCAQHGDNDWPNDLHLADVIEKHLVRPMERR